MLIFHKELTIWKKKFLCCVVSFYLQYSKNMNFALSLDFGAISFLFVPIRCDKVCGLLLGLLACLSDWVLSVSVSLPVKLVFLGLKPVVGQTGHNQRFVSNTYTRGQNVWHGLFTLGFIMFGTFGSVWCKTALAEVVVSLPWWCLAHVFLSPGYWRVFLNLMILIFS